MKEGRELAKITLKIDAEELNNITLSGRLEEFVTKATDIFRRDLKAELVKEAATSVETSLYLIDREYGTWPPRPLPWHNIAKLESLETRLEALELSKSFIIKY